MTNDEDNLFGEEHLRTYRETDGERGYHWRGTEILLLNTTGRKSGEERTTPLIHRTDDGRWVIVASRGGTPDHPGWYHNLSEDPGCDDPGEGRRCAGAGLHGHGRGARAALGAS